MGKEMDVIIVEGQCQYNLQNVFFFFLLEFNFVSHCMHAFYVALFTPLSYLQSES